jgi:hypothetical protein
LGPDTRGFDWAEEFDVDFVGVATDGAVFDVLLFGAGGEVDGDDDALAAGGAGISGFVLGAAAFCFAAFHDAILYDAGVEAVNHAIDATQWSGQTSGG